MPDVGDRPLLVLSILNIALPPTGKKCKWVEDWVVVGITANVMNE